MASQPTILHSSTSPETANDGVIRIWNHPLGDTLHAKLNRLVGPLALQLEFDCDDANFAAALTSRWPHRDDPTNNLVYEHVGLMQLVDNLNQLARLYAIETGNTHVRVIVEARRGIMRLPGWWDGATMMFATFGLLTQAASVCLATDVAGAFEAMPLMDKYNRLMVAFGPGTPEHLRGEDGDIWDDADEIQLRALQRWEQQLTQQLARLLTYTFGGSMFEEETIVDALATMRGSASKVRSAIEGAGRRRNQKGKDKNDTSLSTAVMELKTALKTSADNVAIPLPARAALRHSLGALQTIEQKISPQPYMDIKGVVRVARKAIVKPKPRIRKRRMNVIRKVKINLRMSARRPDEDFNPDMQSLVP